MENSQWVAPMPDICHQWQEKGQVEMDWYFDQVRDYGADRVLYNSLKMNSDLFNKLNEKTIDQKLAPVHVVTTEQFCDLENLTELLEQGVHFAVLIYAPLSTEMICKVENNQKFLNQMQFVILARKDWNVRNCYRSIPHFMRQRLFVDFPISLHSKDPFYEASEVTHAKSKLREDFSGVNIAGFCPHLALLNDWSQKNISNISRPRKLSRTKPQISLIALDADELKALENSKVLADNPDKFEILITRVAGQKTKVIPKFKSVTTTKYWAHPVDNNKEVSPMALANFTATQADGETLLFLSASDLAQLDVLLPLVLEGHGDFAKLLARKDTFIFKKQTFMEKGGFDELIQSWPGQKTDSLVKFYGPDKVTQLLTDDWSEEIKASGHPMDRLVLAHRYSQQIKNFDFVEGSAPTTEKMVEDRKKAERKKYMAAQAREKYMSLFAWNPQVVLEGSISPVKSGVNSFSRKIYNFIRLKLIRLKFKLIYLPLRVFYLFYQAYWTLLYTPASVIYWKLVHLPMKIYGLAVWIYWRLVYFPLKAYEYSVRAYWGLFHLAYPLRKIYYFTHFQYEKRVLGLHQRPSVETGGKGR